jgi:hypothetical protein
MDRLNTSDRCVYTSPEGLCSGRSPLHPNEHYLPRGLGNFKDDIHLNNFICYECQERFSKYEAVFLQNSPEAFYRRILGYEGRSSHARKNIYADPTHGIPPLTVKGFHPTFQHDLLLEMTSQDQGAWMHQVVLKKEDGSLELQPIRRGKLLKDLSRFGEEWRQWKIVGCISGADEEEELQAIFGPEMDTMRDMPMESQGGAEPTARMLVEITLPYIQAISKIAFHFVLARFHFTGFESEFNEIKHFVYHGTGESRLRTVDEPLLLEMIPEEARLRQWSHILTAEFNRQRFISRIQFFAGPRQKPPVLQVDLGKSPSRIVEEMSKGFRYFRYSRPDASGYDGAIEQLTIGPRIYTKPQ